MYFSAKLLLIWKQMHLVLQKTNPFVSTSLSTRHERVWDHLGKGTKLVCRKIKTHLYCNVPSLFMNILDTNRNFFLFPKEIFAIWQNFYMFVCLYFIVWKQGEHDCALNLTAQESSHAWHICFQLFLMVWGQCDTAQYM